MTVLVKLVHRDARVPARASAGDAGFDLSSVADVTILPGGRALIPTGVEIALEPGTVGLVHPRSGLAFRHGITVLNSPGTIDSGYRGELKVLLINHGVEAFHVAPGDRIAQLVIQKYLAPPMQVVEQLSETTRGARGYGSTGVRPLTPLRAVI